MGVPIREERGVTSEPFDGLMQEPEATPPLKKLGVFEVADPFGNGTVHCLP